MKRNPEHRSRRAGFTLLELVVVLAILAVVTTLAFRSLDQVEDQRRYEASRDMLSNIETAVLGDDVVAGFVADMGRLPKTVTTGTVSIADSLGVAASYDMLALTELSNAGTLPVYDVRTSAVDSEVALPSGWRGPYLTLPMDASVLNDGWGNAMRSVNSATPNQPTTLGYHRLRDAADAAVIAADQPVSIVRHLGADGTVGGTGADRDFALSLVNRYQSTVKSVVDFRASDGSPEHVAVGEKVTVRIFAPDASNAATLAAHSATTEAIAIANSVSVPEASASPNAIAGATIGQRAVRAYLYQADGTTLIAASAIKYVTLRPGVNFIPLTIYRP